MLRRQVHETRVGRQVEGAAFEGKILFVHRFFIVVLARLGYWLGERRYGRVSTLILLQIAGHFVNPVHVLCHRCVIALAVQWSRNPALPPRGPRVGHATDHKFSLIELQNPSTGPSVATWLLADSRCPSGVLAG